MTLHRIILAVALFTRAAADENSSSDVVNDSSGENDTYSTTLHIYTKGFSVGTQSCQVRTKWRVNFRTRECLQVKGTHTSKNKPWQSWTSAVDNFAEFYYQPTQYSCGPATLKETENTTAKDLRPTLTQYHDAACSQPTGFELSAPIDECGNWLTGSDNKTQYEKFRLDCGGALRGSMQSMVVALFTAFAVLVVQK